MPDVVLLDVDSRKEYIYEDFPDPRRNFQWSPDMTMIAYVKYVRDFGNGIYLLTDINSMPNLPEWMKRTVLTGGFLLADVRPKLIETSPTFELDFEKEGVEDSLSWSPDSSRIAFSVRRNYAVDLYVVRIDGSGLVRLTQGGDNSSPDWSPDGKWIVFASASLEEGPRGISIMNSNGSNRIPLTPDLSNDYLPRWSPDGSYITFVSWRDGNGEIHMMGADGSRLIRLTNDTATDTDPTWLPIR